MRLRRTAGLGPLREVLLASALAFCSEALAANLSVDATQTVRTVDERVFGVNMVIWDQAGSSAQTLSLLQAAGFRTLRFPGGSLSDTYVWSQDRSYNTDPTSPNYGQLNTWAWFLTWAQFANVVTGLSPRPQVFITVNYGSGTPQLAANWVTDANVSRGLGLKYWEIGNECYGSWEYDTHAVPHDPFTYAMAARDYIQQMKAVDPTIKVGVVGTTGEDSYANNTSHPATNPRTGVTHNGWTPVMLATLRALGVTPDFLIYHRYPQSPGQESDAGLLQNAATWPSDAVDLRQQLSDYLGAAGASVELVVTENNSVFSDPGKQTTSLVNGLFLADSLGQLLKTGFNAYMWWAFRNGPPTNNGMLVGNQSASLYGWRLYGDYGMLSTPSTATGETSAYTAYPTYYVMKLLSHFARGGDTIVPTTSDNTLLSIYAAKRTDGTLALLVINKSPTVTQTGNFTLTGFTPASNATVYSYGITQDDAARTGVGSADVGTATITNAAATFAVAFTPYSATVLALSPATVTITTQPANQVVTAGNSAMFSVLVGSGAGATYQWQRQAGGSGVWADVADSSTYSGSTAATLTVSGPTTAMNGDAFRCVITLGGSSTTSSSATLTVNAAPSGGGGSSGGGGGGGGPMGPAFVLALALLAVARCASTSLRARLALVTAGGSRFNSKNGIRGVPCPLSFRGPDARPIHQRRRLRQRDG